MSTYRVAVLIGSLREASLNRKMAQNLIELAPDNLEFTIVEIGDLPLYNPDLDTEEPPAAWTRFRDTLQDVQAFLFCTPEYNRSMPAPLKNALDVGSRPPGQSIWSGKPAAVVSVTPGALGGFASNHNLRQAMVTLNVPVMQRPEAYIGRASDLFDDDGRIQKDDTREYMKKFVQAFADWVDKNA